MSVTNVLGEHFVWIKPALFGLWAQIAPRGERDRGKNFKQGLMFVGTRGAEAGANLVEGRVGIARMADELPHGCGVVRLGRDQGTHGRCDIFRAGCAGREDADGAGSGF